MELLQLYYFQMAARCEHVSAAAAKLNIAQPALSQTIKRLENELGTPLFDREGKHIRLNAYGRVFLKYTDTVLGALKDARSELADMSDNPNAQISFSVQAASSLLPDILEKFCGSHPDIHFNIIQSAAADDTAGDIDLTLHAAATFEDHPDNVLLLKEPLMVALPSNHPLAVQRQLNLCDLKDQSFASLCKGSNLYEITRYYCSLAGFEPQISLSCDNPQAFRQLLGLNMGIALVPAITWPDLTGSGIITRPVADICCQRYLLLSRKSARYLSRPAQLFAGFLEDYFGQLQRPISPTGCRPLP